MKSFMNAWKIPELRRRILFTAGLLAVYRLGCHVPVPGVDARALGEYFRAAQNTLFGLYDLFVGGAFGRATIFALGIMPYISASIILQLFGSVIPYFQKLQKEGPEGYRKITQYTRYGTVLLAALQSYGVGIFLQGIKSPSGVPIVPNPGLGFLFLTMVTITAGTVFVMWLGEQITERGIGQGISLIIFTGIIARLPDAVLTEISQLRVGARSAFTEIVLIGIILAVTGVVVYVTQGQRRIPVQYAKRVVGRRMYGGQSTHIPLRVNTAGMIPIIFAQAIMFLPSTMAQFFQGNEIMDRFAGLLSYGSWLYWLLYGSLIVFFTYFYTAVVVNPVDLADNMKKYGGFIPGVRPGKRTSEYIDRVLTRITLPGAIYLALIAILPYFVIRSLGIYAGWESFVGGAGTIIIVGVALDTLQQMEAHLLMRHYEGFLRRGRIRGRRRF